MYWMNFCPLLIIEGGGGGRLANSTGGVVRYLLMRVLSRL